MAKMLDIRGTISKIFQIGKETALKSTDDSLEVVSAQFPAERKNFQASTASFEGLVLPNAILNATDNRFTKNPISNGYELVYDDKRILITVDQDTGTVESSNGFGIKNSGYVSNCILGFKAPVSVSGMVVTMPAGFNINYSNGRDVFDETANPTGKGVLKSYNSITDTAYTVTVTPTGDDVTVSCYVLYDDTAKELFYVNKDQLYYGIKVPTVASGYTVCRDSNGNEYYRLVDGSWVKRHLMRVASFDLTDGKTIENFEPCYPCDLLKLADYLVADSGGGRQKVAIRSMEIPASTAETTSIALDYACEDKNAMLVLIEHTVVPPSTYNISANGKILTFTTPIPAGMRIDLRWFSNIEVVKVDVPLASDTEFMQGMSEVLAPNVKQVKTGLVTTDTNQTITSTKTYTTFQAKKSLTIDISTTPDAYQANDCIQVLDKNNNIMGWFATAVAPASQSFQGGEIGEVCTIMDAKNKDGYQAGIRVNVPVEGTSGAYVACPSYDEAKSPSNAIVTKNKIANMVTTNTEQTVSATKTLTNSVAFKYKLPISKDEAPETNQSYRLFNFVDANDDIVGLLDFTKETGGEVSLRLDTRNNTTWYGLSIVNKGVAGANYISIGNPPDSVKGAEAITAYWAIKNLTYVSLPTAANMVSITIGASGTKYTAPDDGWFAVYASGGQSNSCQLINTTTGIMISTPGITGFDDASAFIPARKGETVLLRYTGTLSADTAWFRFYRGGANNDIYS